MPKTYIALLTAALVAASAFSSVTRHDTLQAAEGQTASPEKEAELLAILRSDAPQADKALACKHLSVYGSSEAVPVLARLLSDEQLSSWARIALEAIPGPAADEALRTATNSLQGKLLVGTINSIGVRRDAAAVELLSSRLDDQDADVASAAVAALGKIGNAAAAKSLRPALASAPAKVRSVVAESCVLCAERMLAEGNSADAAKLYDEVRNADVPKQRIIEATRGAILARKPDEGITLLLEQLRSSEKGLFQLALGTAREFPGNQIDQALATELAKTAPERAALVVQAMADRRETVVLPAVLKAAEKGPKPVRLAAVAALGRVGDATCLSSLLGIAIEADADLGQSAKAALADLPGENVDKDIVARLAKADGKLYPLLIELVGQRRIEAVAALLKALDHSDKAVRTAALTSLGNTVPAKNLSVLVAQVVTPKHAEDVPVAQVALKTASVRMPDREACATELSAALDKASVPTKAVLLEILGEVGGTKALHTLRTAAKSDNPQLQDVSSKLLGEWMTIDAAPVLLDLAKTGPGDKYQVRALKGYIRIARQFVMNDDERVAMCQTAFDATRQPAERKMVLEIVKRYPTLDMLKLAVKATQIPELKDEGTQAVLVVAQKVGSKKDEVKELLTKAGVEPVKLEIIKAEYGAGDKQRDVTETLRKQISELPFLPLPGNTYSSSFGGDPAPGAAKQLKVQYKLNGKAGEATFPENALIIIPTK